MAGQGIAVTGEIKFDQTPPKSPLPKPSVLIVKLQDCRRAGAAAIDVGSVEVDAHLTYHEGQPLVYTMKVPSLSMIDYSMSAVLNVGWLPDKSKDDWIRRGDYLNDTTHRLCLSDPHQSQINCDIAVVHYT